MNLLREHPAWLLDWSPASRLSVLGVALVAGAVFGLLYMGFPVYVIPLGGLLLAFGIMTLRSPTLGVCAVIAFQYVPLQLGGVTLLQAAGAAVTVLCLIWFAIHQRGLYSPNVVVPMVVLGLLILFSLNYTRDPAGAVSGFRKMIFNVMFCLLLVNVVDNYRRLRWPLWTLAAMAAVNSLAAGHQFVVRNITEFRASGLLEDENQLGEVAAVGFIIPFYCFLYEKDFWKRMGYLVLCGLLSIGIVTSVSRGAVISFFVGLAYVFMREVRRRRRRLLLVAVLLLLAVPFLPGYFFERFKDIGQEMKGTVFVGQRTGLSTRGYFNKAAIRIWKTHPLMGVGFGSFGYYYIQPEFNTGLKASSRLPPHNTYLEALVELGLVGFLVLCWWVLQCAYNYWRAARKGAREPSEQLALRICETLTLMVLVSSFSGGTIVSTQFVMMIALSAVCRRCSERSPVRADAAIP